MTLRWGVNLKSTVTVDKQLCFCTVIVFLFYVGHVMLSVRNSVPFVEILLFLDEANYKLFKSRKLPHNVYNYLGTTHFLEQHVALLEEIADQFHLCDHAHHLSVARLSYHCNLATQSC